ncbi:MAG: hypothetical protein ACK5LS_10755 [Propioniciclava sp.]
MRRVVPLATHDLAELACPWCGRTVGVATFGLKTVRDGEVLGLLAAAHAEAIDGFYPRASVILTQLWVRPQDRGELVGTQLIQRLAARLAPGPTRCIVAHGTVSDPTCQQLPAAWLEDRGFTRSQARGQWRLDLRRTIRLPDAVHAALKSTVGVVRPERPAPAGRSAERLGYADHPSSPGGLIHE